MAAINVQVVQRSWGLFELATRNPKLALATTPQSSEREDTTNLSYGSQFKYEEFLALPSRLHSFLLMLFLVIIVKTLRLFPPVGSCHFYPLEPYTKVSVLQARWMARRLMPQPGDGPPEEYVSSPLERTRWSD